MAIKVGVISLGCPKNRVDSEIMLANIMKAGYTVTDNPHDAQVVIVNTCGFIEDAKTESIETILEISKIIKNRGGKLIVTGCLAQRYHDELLADMPEIDAMLGVYDYDSITKSIDDVLKGERTVRVGGSPKYMDAAERIVSTPKHYAYLKIADGCDNRCSYCAIPSIRGNYTSRGFDSLVAEAVQLAGSGVREMIVVAQDTTRYGLDIGLKNGLISLLDALSAIVGIKMIRIMYAYPESVDEQLFKYISENEKICNYLDLPIQHISDRILKLMNRRGGPESIIKAVKLAKKYGVSLRTSVIAGFPTETEEEFNQ
ncbi:MAG TPA: MiaB/RimO family radical SAM methylthiotransferase, partial [Clostridia bacterium]|nr:MiaB/RimO family radical SAM methylthiotransferase [Clostridia bacterium]